MKQKNWAWLWASFFSTSLIYLGIIIVHLENLAETSGAAFAAIASQIRPLLEAGYASGDAGVRLAGSSVLSLLVLCTVCSLPIFAGLFKQKQLPAADRLLIGAAAVLFYPIGAALGAAGMIRLVNPFLMLAMAAPILLLMIGTFGHIAIGCGAEEA